MEASRATISESDVAAPSLRAKIAGACLFGMAAVGIGYAWWAFRLGFMVSGLNDGTVSYEEFISAAELG
ncbi:MAG: hypothetical protein AAGC55_04520, partial [Myxococcota bacterium]